MLSTIDLLGKALKVKSAAEWCRALNVTDSALSKLRKKGHLSPGFAAYMATEIGADPIYWTALAVAEAEPEGPAKERLAHYLKCHKTVVP